MQQQHLMQPMMAAYANPGSVTTDLIQQYLDENKQLILAILDNQNSGKVDECAQNQAKLQRNLMYLAAIADSQPQIPTVAQLPPNPVMQSGPPFGHPQQAQQMTPQSLMAARSLMLYGQPQLSALQQQQLQQQQQALHSQLQMSSGGDNGLHMRHGETSMEGGPALSAGGFPDFGRGSGVGKPDSGARSAGGRGGKSGGQSGGGTEPLYVKGSEEEGN